MSVTRVTEQSWSQRIGGAFGGLIFGLILTAGAFVLLFWNEGRAVRMAKALQEGAKVVLPVDAGGIDPANEGKLIHFSGRTEVDEALQDAEFGVREAAVKLQREVEMYQWKEDSESNTEKKLGGGTETTTTYRYRKEWSESLIDSSTFQEPQGHGNPSSMRLKSRTVVADPVRVGAFRLPGMLVGKIQGWTALAAPGDDLLPEAIREGVQRSGGALFFGENPSSPQIGDLRVTFSIVPLQEVSVVANQAGDSLEAFVGKSGASVALLDAGVRSAEVMFEAAQNQNRIVTWLVRLGGFLLMMFGFNLLFRPMAVLADVVPLFGNIVGAGTGFIAFLLAGAFSAVTIGVAWFVYRPLIAIPLFVVTVVLLIFAGKRMRAAKTA